MSMTISDPHDALFKEMFSRKDVAEDFLHGVLPVEIRHRLDFSTLTHEATSYVDEELQKFYSDVGLPLSIRWYD